MPSRHYLVIVAAGFTLLFIAYAARTYLSVVMPAIEADLDMSRAATSGAAATVLVVMALLAPLAGAAADSNYSRILLVGGLLLLSSGMLIAAAATSAGVFLFAFAGVASTGFAIVSWNFVTSVCLSGIEQRVGLFSGIINAGSSAGPVLLLPLLSQLEDWRTGFVYLGVASLGMAAAVLLLRHTAGGPREPASAPIANRIRASAVAAALMVRDPTFNVLFWTFFFCGFTTTGVIETHLIPYLGICGFSPLESTSAFSVLSLVNLAGVIVAGLLADRTRPDVVLATIYLLRGSLFVVLMFLTNGSPELLVGFSIAFGLVDYSTVPPTVAIAQKKFGGSSAGLCLGFIAAGHGIGAALGAVAGGLIFDSQGAYGMLWQASALMSVFAGLIFLWPRRSADAIT